jgi:aspartate aminotransferase
MQEVSQLLQRLSESATLAMARISRELAAKGHSVISLSLGEPDFNTPDFIKEAAKQAIDNNYTHYPPVNGYLEVREAISKKFLRDNGLHYNAEQIVISTGAKQSIANAVLALINPGDEVILPAPFWVTYQDIVKLAGGIPIILSTNVEDDFKLSPQQLEAAITPKTRMIIYSSPCNPSGTVYSKSELEAFAAVLRKYPQILVISDEIYELINFSGGHASIASLDGMYDRTITVNGVSKGFAMTGWRIGYLGAPLWIAKAVSKMQGQFTSAPTGIAQMATKAAVEADPSVVKDMQMAFRKRRDFLLERLKTIDRFKCNIPDGAFYIFPDVTAYFGTSNGEKTINTAEELCNYLLEEEYVAVVTGEAFGDDRCIRLAYATSESTLDEAVTRMKRALDKLK